MENHNVSHHVLQLADVSRPTVVHEQRVNIFIKVLEGFSIAFRELAQAMACNFYDVPSPLSQCRQRNGNNIQAVIEIFTETPSLNVCPSIADWSRK